MKAKKIQIASFFSIFICMIVIAGCNKNEIKKENVTSGSDSLSVTKKEISETQIKKENQADTTIKKEVSETQIKKETTDSIPVLISSSEASSHVGQKVILKGNVAQVIVRSKVIYLNIDAKFPVNRVSAVIFEDKVKLFDNAEQFQGKDVEIKGEVIKFKGKSEIVLNDPSQIRTISK